MGACHKTCLCGTRLASAPSQHDGNNACSASPAARPGQLRDLVAAHLSGHPAGDFTPHQIGRVLSRSSGAVANALDRLTALGQAAADQRQAPPLPPPGPSQRPRPGRDHLTTPAAAGPRSRRPPWPGSSLSTRQACAGNDAPCGATLTPVSVHEHGTRHTGFMVFEAPLATYVNNEGREVQIVAVSWGPWNGPRGRWAPEIDDPG
jgi:hypothetical protein